MEVCEICGRHDGTVVPLCVSVEIKDLVGGVSAKLGACAKCRCRVYDLSPNDLLRGIQRMFSKR